MKSLRVYFFSAVVIALPATFSIATESTTDSDSTDLNNPIAQSCGVTLSLPDYLVRNTDDDQEPTSECYEEWDRDNTPSPGEGDLKVVTITGTAGPLGGTMTLEITGGSSMINGTFWKDGEKNEQQGELSWDVNPNTSRSETMYIEGYDNSAEKDDVKMKATMTCPGGVVDGQAYLPAEDETTDETTVYEVDLDVDSNNNNQFAFDGFDDAEDKIEASEKTDSNNKKKPGKYLFVNAGFNAANNDGTPGWADGFNINPNDTEDDEAAVFKFTPIQIKLKKPFDPGKAKIKFTYSASDPAGVTSAAGGGTPDHPYTYTLGQEGQLRIWKKDGPGSRGKASVAAATDAGDFVPKDADIDWSKIGSGDTAQLYLEAVRPSGALGDLVINIEVTQDDVKCTDEVRVTSVSYADDAVIDLTTTATDYQLQIVGSDGIYGSVGGDAVKYSASAKLVPDGVDFNAYPISNYKVGIMQNLISSTRTNVFENPTLAFLPSAPHGARVTYPNKITSTSPYPGPRVNDSRVEVAPLYDQPGKGDPTLDENSVAPPLNAPGGKSATSKDNPGHEFHFAFDCTEDTTHQVVANINYAQKTVVMKDVFATWVVGYNLDTKDFYPLRERKWELSVSSLKSAPQNPQLPFFAAQTAVTIVPVRSPFANDTLDGVPAQNVVENPATVVNP